MACRVAKQIKLIACFCGCSELEVKEVLRMTQCRIGDFLRNPDARLLLSQYIIKELLDEEDNLILKYLRMYEVGLEFLSNPKRDDRAVRQVRNNFEDFDVYPNEKLETMVKEAFNTRNVDVVYEALKDLQTELEYQIEFSEELMQMKEILLKKIDAATRDPTAKRK